MRYAAQMMWPLDGNSDVSMLCAGIGIFFPQISFENVVAIQRSIMIIEIVRLRLIDDCGGRLPLGKRKRL